ncbi:MAG: hypothetical protein HN919_19675 [Verrucomicrobia bacterium]|jgi:beta-galactosidase|nr:hypothetical protein [Verrucomicrobiota bacterium]MBT7068524.1 hypothetical protein [Verrucomicrobiota bacterium]MBT7701930.1 hypothetical protein [Verrucomicrobiota bacterium]
MNRDRIDLNQGWLFQQRKQRETVDLPHCWNRDDTFTEGVAYYRGQGVYARTFSLPADISEKGGQWILCSGGFYGRGRIKLNGALLPRVDGQFIGFEIDVTSLLNSSGDNRIRIELSNRHHPHVLPGIKDPDFLLHGGLTGEVWLERRSLNALVDASVAVSWSDETVSVDYALASGDDGAPARVVWKLEGPEGACLAEAEGQPEGHARLNPGEVLARWTLDQPRMHEVIGQVFVDGICVDEVRKRFGVRELEWRRGEGLVLNGARVEIRGCNRHESMPGHGSALPTEWHRKDAETIKAMGLNAVRLAHYPQSPAFLDACDELGILVYAEIATWKSVTTGRWLDAAERQLRAMILRDRHHPSIILWGLGNESRSRVAYERLGRVVRELDPSRRTTYAENHLYRAKRERALNLIDVWGCNYELDVLDEVQDYCSTGTAIVSECSNSPHAERGNLRMEWDQVMRVSGDLDAIAERPAVAGFFIWSFQDYATLRKKRYKRCCGLVDAWRIPKLAFWMLKARFGQEPVVKIAAECTDGPSGPTLTIYWISTEPVSQLHLDGRLIAERTGPVLETLDLQDSGDELVAIGMTGERHTEDRLTLGAQNDQ